MNTIKNMLPSISRKITGKLKNEWSEFRAWCQWVRPRHIHYYLTVEPSTFLIHVSVFVFYLGISPVLLKRKVTRLYGDWTPANHNWTRAEYEDSLQAHMIRWNQWQFGINSVVGMLFMPLYGSWSDHVGRQFNILLGTFAIQVNTMFCVACFSYSFNWPMIWYVVTGAIEGVLGNLGTAVMASQAYITDLVTNENERTFRLNVLQIIRGLGGLVGTMLTALFANKVGLIEFSVVGNSMMLLVLAWTLGWVHMIPADVLQRARVQWKQQQQETLTTDNRGIHVESTEDRKLTLMTILRTIWMQYVECYQTYTKPRTGWKRACIWLIVFVNLATLTTETEVTTIMGTYTQFAPLYWTGSDLFAWTVHQLILKNVISFCAIFVLKKLVHIRDTLMLIVILLVWAVSNLPIAFATDFNMYLSNWLAACGMLINPTLMSLLSTFVGPEEVGKCFVAFGFTSYLGQVIQNLVLQNLYVATMDWFPGFIFVLIAGVNILNAGVVAVVHFINK